MWPWAFVFPLPEQKVEPRRKALEGGPQVLHEANWALYDK
jgi:hypothetical protein